MSASSTPGRDRVEAALAHQPGQAAGGGDIAARERGVRALISAPTASTSGSAGSRPNGGGVGLVERQPGRGEVIAVEGQLRGGEGDQARGVGIGWSCALPGR